MVCWDIINVIGDAPKIIKTCFLLRQLRNILWSYVSNQAAPFWVENRSETLPLQAEWGIPHGAWMCFWHHHLVDSAVLKLSTHQGTLVGHPIFEWRRQRSITKLVILWLQNICVKLMLCAMEDTSGWAHENATEKSLASKLIEWPVTYSPCQTKLFPDKEFLNKTKNKTQTLGWSGVRPFLEMKKVLVDVSMDLLCFWWYWHEDRSSRTRKWEPCFSPGPQWVLHSAWVKDKSVVTLFNKTLNY